LQIGCELRGIGPLLPEGDGGVVDPPLCTEARCPQFLPGDPHYARVEAPDAENACSSDQDCAKQGCSDEVCVSAPASVVTSCDWHEWFPREDCGCVDGTCMWFR